MASIAKATGGDPGKGVYAYPARLGYWPAAVGLYAFVWQELVNPQSAYIGPVRLWLAVYLGATFLVAFVIGYRMTNRRGDV